MSEIRTQSWVQRRAAESARVGRAVGRCLCLCLFAVGGDLCAGEADVSRVTLRSQATVAGPTVRVADVLNFVQAEPQLVEQVAEKTALRAGWRAQFERPREAAGADGHA